ncbi:transposase [Thermodesulfobacteriota bacterium]
MGEIKGLWLEEEKKIDILLNIKEAKENGITKSRTCAMWWISRRRVTRWASARNRGEGLSNGKPGPKEPFHRLLDEERVAVVAAAKEESYVDLSHRTLAVTAWDEGLFFMSFSSVYRIMCSEGLMSMRGSSHSHNGRSLPPERKEITGANQRWCWDISYLRTYEKGLFLFLYLLLDEFSRKVINWLVSWHQRAEEARELLEGGLMAENILDLPEDQRPEIINDRGWQMKAGSIKSMFKLHGMPQLFARPRTPNDNPFVESAFGTVKCAPQYPGRFLDRREAVGYFDRYFHWYNTEHLHSGIDYVTPDQCHRGLRDQIVAERRKKLAVQQRLRKEVNRRGRDPSQGPSMWSTATSTLYHVA